MGGEALGPVMCLCRSIGECQDQEWEWVEDHLCKENVKMRFKDTGGAEDN
ncbi:hypothetical protein T4D_8291 [Trichinella pseudospiralis]|uniref:Uncharacterized protein n=1 Tax=Trichinella pseudospiralis TaxID=6337 RepID=A0A0V1DMG9_TRIPS|nr:hypothetical protein T4D_8291 [Trichinella pseudospiralis]